MKENYRSERRYDLDWMRVICIFIVLLFHVGMIYNGWSFHIKNPVTFDGFKYVMAFLHQWRMPLLLLISGAAAMYATSGRGTRGFIKERSKRLLIPLIFAMLVIVPPQIYFERIANFSSFGEFYKTVFDFVPYPKGGSLSWHHMWFVLYLLLYSLLCLPLMNYLHSEKSDKFRTILERFFTYRWSFLSIFLIPLLSQIILRPYFPEETHGLFDDWAYFCWYGSFYILGIIITSTGRIWDLLANNRRIHLTAGIVLYIVMLIMFEKWEYFEHLGVAPDTLDVIWNINELFLGWSWVIALAGYGKIYLNKENKAIKFMNEGIYPFYILHQTVIISIGYYYMQFDTNVASGFIMVSILSFIVTVLLYLGIVKPFNFMRFLFGMKPKPVKILKVTDKNLETAQ